MEDLDSVRKMTERNFSLQYLNAENRRFNGSSSYRENSRKIRRILKNEKYKGDVLQGKTYTTDHITHKRVVNMGEENQYYIKEHHQAIIVLELFNKVQESLEKRAGSREKEKLNSKINKLIDLRLDNAIDRDTFLDRKEKLQAQIEQLNMKQEKLMLDERNNTNRKLSLNKIRKFLETGDIVTEFEADKIFKDLDRNTVVYVIPFMNEIYNNREKYFEPNKYELISTEAWQIYDNFSKLDNIKTNCNLDVKLELATDMKKYADCVMSCYQTDDKDDPYGDLDEGYKQSYINYKKIYDDIESEFYYIKVDNKIVGTTQSVYNNKICGIYGLAIKKEYRNKGIGKEVLKQQLQMCKGKKINIAYLQTELDFYPNKMYKKFGFKDLCTVYYYMKK